MKFRRLMALLVSVALASAAQQSAGFAVQAAAPAVPSQQAGQAEPLRVSGTVFQSDRRTPAANACLRLRNIDTNTLVARAMSDSRGAFSFAVADAGMYVVEVVKCDDDGVRAVSDVLAVTASSLTISMVVPATLAATLFSTTGLLVLSAAAAAGITAAVISGSQGQGGGSGGVLSPER
jgi:hypothetical protein